MDSCFSGVYKGKKILITGHTGFKGAWLSIFLHELGAEVLGYSLEPPTAPNLFSSATLKDKIIHIIGDVRDENKLLSVLNDFQPQFIFHLAAQSLVRLSYLEPKLTYETNIMGTVNLFEAIRKTESVRVVVNVTSDKCYENKEWIYGYREDDPLGGHDPYSSSKGCAEIVTSAYRSSFFSISNKRVSLSSARAGNVIGGGDWAEDRLVPDCIKSLSQGKPIIVRYPNAIRPWQYILEPLSGYLWLGALMYKDGITYSGAWNFGPNNDAILSVEKVVTLVTKYWGEGTHIYDIQIHPHEATLLKLDCSKAHALLKWRSAYDVEKAVEETVRWYKKYYSSDKKEETYNTSVNQIIRYIESAREKSIPWSVK